MQRGGSPNDPEEPVSIEGPPPLARLAALMALVDLFWNRVVVRVLAGVDEQTGIAFQRAGVFPRNLAAVAGLIALAAAIFGALRMAGYSGLLRRLGVSSVAGILLPAFLLALVLPKEQLSIVVVFVALVASSVVAVLVGSVALGYPAGARRWAVGVATANASLVLLGLVVGTVPSIAQSAFAPPLGLIAHHGTEVTWHLLPIFALVGLLGRRAEAPASEGPPLSRGFVVVALVLFVATVGLALFGQSHLHAHRFATLVYGALRVTLIPESVGWLNALSVGLAVAASVIGLSSRRPGRAQLGAAAALWLAAGCAPRAPGQLLDFVLAVMLLARACQSWTRAGRDRARLPWAPITQPSTAPGSGTDSD